MSRFILLPVLAFLVPAPLLAQRTWGPQVKQFVSTDDRLVAITHVRVIDGLAAPAAEDQTVVMTDGKITAVGKSSSVSVPAGAKTIDGTGKTVIPGLIG